MGGGNHAPTPHIAEARAGRHGRFRARPQAQHPARPVHLIVGFSQGGNTDIVARLIGEWLTRQMGQPFIVENRSGAATNIATELVVHSPADGYTLLVSSTANAINATLYRNLKFNFISDTEPIVAIVTTPLVMCVNPSFPRNLRLSSSRGRKLIRIN